MLDSWYTLWDMSISVQLVAVTSRHADHRCSGHPPGSVAVLWKRLVVLLFTRRIAYSFTYRRLAKCSGCVRLLAKSAVNITISERELYW